MWSFLTIERSFWSWLSLFWLFLTACWKLTYWCLFRIKKKPEVIFFNVLIFCCGAISFELSDFNKNKINFSNKFNVKLVFFQKWSLVTLLTIRILVQVIVWTISRCFLDVAHNFFSSLLIEFNNSVSQVTSNTSLSEGQQSFRCLHIPSYNLIISNKRRQAYKHG